MAELRQNLLGEDANVEHLVLEPMFRAGRTHFKTAMNLIRAHVDL